MEKKIFLHLGIVVLFILVFVMSFASASFGDWFKEITGKATNTVDLNITIGGPQIRLVMNQSITDVSSGLQAGPLPTTVVVNFTVYTDSGAGNLDLTTAKVNFTRGSEELRENVTCNNYDNNGNYANFTCNVTMFWYDQSGTWNITAYIKDNESNAATNTSTDFQVGSTTGFDMGPVALTFAGLAPGGANRTSNNDPLLLNNTGNTNIGLDQGTNISINATNLRGETTDTLAIWASNFSVSWNTGGTPPAECDVGVIKATQMDDGNFTNITGTNLSAGNFSINDNKTGQEQIFFCILYAGSELTTQAYSTSNESSWTVQIA